MNLGNKIDVHLIYITDLRQVALVHLKAFPESALTRLGLEPTRRYYEWQLTGPHQCYPIGAFEQDSLIGFCFAGIFRGALIGFLTKNKSFLIRWIVMRPWLILNPIVTDRLKVAFRSLTKKSFKGNTPKQAIAPFYGILSIAVDPSKQGSGVGKIILNKVEDDAKQKGFDVIQLTVHPTNLQAVAFYERTGWVKKLSESTHWTGHMEKVLNKS